jgi:hypothetical protein
VSPSVLTSTVPSSIIPFINVYDVIKYCRSNNIPDSEVLTHLLFSVNLVFGRDCPVTIVIDQANEAFK